MSRLTNTRPQAQTPAQGIPVQEAPSTALTVYDQIQGQLESRKSFIADALARWIDLDIFMARVMNEVRKNPDLARCTFPSLMGAVITSAQLGLEVGPLGHFYLTPRLNSFKDDRGQWAKRWEVVPVIGYKGFIALARRASGVTIDADDRCENDRWIYRRGTDPYLETAPPDRGDRGEILGYWAAAKFEGGSAAHYMNLYQLEEHAKQYASNKKSGEVQGFAKVNWPAWCRKTAIRQMTWKLPQSTELNRAVAADESATYWSDADASMVTVTQDGRVEDVEPAPVTTNPTEADEAAAATPVDGGYDPSTEKGFGTDEFRG